MMKVGHIGIHLANVAWGLQVVTFHTDDGLYFRVTGNIYQKNSVLAYTSLGREPTENETQKMGKFLASFANTYGTTDSELSVGASKIPGVHDNAIHPITKHHDTIFSIVINLNDAHKWTRDQIADWLETLDNLPVFTPKESSENL